MNPKAPRSAHLPNIAPVAVTDCHHAEVEILHVKNAGPTATPREFIAAGACYVETDLLLVEGAELTITLEKSGDLVKRRRESVRASPRAWPWNYVR